MCVMFYTFTKFLTIHQKNCNQIYYQWCSLNDRSECYSKRYSVRSRISYYNIYMFIYISFIFEYILFSILASYIHLVP